MKIYVASSWRNKYQPIVVRALREEGYEVYDYRHPTPNNDGFGWTEIDPNWQGWLNATFREALNHPTAERGFKFDFDAMKACDVCVLVLPCGRSAHLELGWCAGAGKRTVILLLDYNEPELMYKMADAICVDVNEVIAELRAWTSA